MKTCVCHGEQMYREENARNARTAGSQHPFHARAEHQEWCLPCRVELFIDKSEQMEEALRDIAGSGPISGSVTPGEAVTNELADIARAALSPSDTEEEA